MPEKKIAEKEKIENSQVDLKEILSDIKTVVSGEKETLFKESEYKTIKLKKENLVASGEKKQSPVNGNLNDKEFENLVRRIVRNELKNLELNDKAGRLGPEKTKAVKIPKAGFNMNSFKKSELIALSKKNKLTINGKNTKAEIIKKLKENNVKAL